MSRKARRRPSWKAYKKGEDAFIMHLIDDKTDELLETIRIPKMGYVGRYLKNLYGDKVEERLSQIMVDYANEILAWEKFNEVSRSS